MAAIIGSPTRYIQGKGEMKNLCSYADKFGKNLFILTSASGRKRVEPAINEGNKAETKPKAEGYKDRFR